MLDINLIRNQPEYVARELHSRDEEITFETIKAVRTLDETYRRNLKKVEELKAERNTLSREIGQLGGPGKATEQYERVLHINEELGPLDKRVNRQFEKLKAALQILPNIPLADVPRSHSKDDYKIIVPGEPQAFGFQPQSHLELATNLGILDMQRGAKISGPKMPIFKGEGSLLIDALDLYMRDIVLEAGFVDLKVPHIVNHETMYGAGVLPKFAKDIFRVMKLDGKNATNPRHWTEVGWLIPTSEIALAGYHRNEVLDLSEGPLRYTASTSNYRREAPSGKRDEGLLKTPEFKKREMVIYATPDQAYEELDRMRDVAKRVVDGLGLKWREILVPTSDLGQQCAITYDIEVWIPSIEQWREVSSCSICTDYQSRRNDTKYVDPERGKQFVWTLNGTGTAINRVWLAIVEQYQTKEGNVVVPKILQPYMNGLQTIKK